MSPIIATVCIALTTTISLRGPQATPSPGPTATPSANAPALVTDDSGDACVAGKRYTNNVLPANAGIHPTDGNGGSQLLVALWAQGWLRANGLGGGGGRPPGTVGNGRNCTGSRGIG